ncbi:MAG: hypothetical protein AAF721_08220, partial [Myxococcota bacterium]
MVRRSCSRSSAFAWSLAAAQGLFACQSTPTDVYPGLFAGDSESGAVRPDDETGSTGEGAGATGEGEEGEEPTDPETPPMLDVGAPAG